MTGCCVFAVQGVSAVTVQEAKRNLTAAPCDTAVDVQHLNEACAHFCTTAAAKYARLVPLAFGTYALCFFYRAVLAACAEALASHVNDTIWPNVDVV